MKRSVGLIFGFFFPLGWKTGKTRGLALLGLFPVLLAVVARIFLRGRTGDMSAVFTEILMVFFLQLYIVILSLFYGTSVVAEEVENRTLSYLVTRPVPETAIVLGKYAAYALQMFVMVGSRARRVLLHPERAAPRRSGPLPDVPALPRRPRAGDPGLHGLLHLPGHFPQEGHHRRSHLRLRLGEHHPVLPRLDAEVLRRPLPEIAAALPAGGSRRRGRQPGVALLLFRLEPTPPFLAVLALAAIAAVFLGLACGPVPDEGIPLRRVGPAGLLDLGRGLVLLDLDEVAGLGLGQLAELVHEAPGTCSSGSGCSPRPSGCRWSRGPLRRPAPGRRTWRPRP
ncbi:MAG: ABC transporter permease [Candidatus Moduliflexus flocculans]|nr:ABC transporter permease [Candidatus Moduliflexus flocculans]